MSTRAVVTLVLVCISLVADVVGVVHVTAQSKVPTEIECDVLYLAPGELITVEPRIDGIGTKAQVYLRSQVAPGGEQKFTLQLFDSHEHVALSETVKTLSVLSGGVEVVTIVDVEPEFLRVDPGGPQRLQVTANDPVYYFGLIWETILDQLSFSDDPEQSDVGRVVVPSIYDVSPQYYSRADLFNYLVPRLTRIALAEDLAADNEVVAKSVSDWRSQLDSMPRMIVVLRWRDQPFELDGAYYDLRNAMSTRLVPIVVVDIGQPITGSEPSDIAGSQQDLYVLPLGPVPSQLGETYPSPFNPTWDFARQYVARHVTNRTAAIMERAARPIRRRFDIDASWPVVVSHKQAEHLVLRVKAELSEGGEESCSRVLQFPIESSRSWTRRLAILYLGVLLISGLTVASATYLVVSWMPVSLVLSKKAHTEWQRHTHNMPTREE